MSDTQELPVSPVTMEHQEHLDHKVSPELQELQEHEDTMVSMAQSDIQEPLAQRENAVIQDLLELMVKTDTQEHRAHPVNQVSFA